jgi:hypothetical protein
MLGQTFSFKLYFEVHILDFQLIFFNKYNCFFIF